MPLPETTESDLVAHLHDLGVRHGDRIVVHSRLISFGNIRGGVATVYAAFQRVLGDSGTLAVPTYTAALDEASIFDPTSTPSQDTGVFSEFVRKQKGAVRSRCPMHSHAAVGPDAHLLSLPSGNFSIGPGSDFELLLNAKFSLVLLGCSFKEGATFIHHSEVAAKVPYRVPLDLPRLVLGADGASVSVSCRYYGRPTTEYCENFDFILSELRGGNSLRSAACPLASSFFIPLADLHAATTQLLLRDPYALVYKGENPYTIDQYMQAGLLDHS
ncbi:MAG: AAC(3) family N-acetyltransferase [Alphaproteobacteria bacterium]|nr:AAC(3) family N-acetyltransferase [Alphaproteobacteria bacterium]